MASMSWSVASIHTYPLKGFPGQSLTRAHAKKHGLLDGDRRYGLTSGTELSQSAPTDQWLKKAHFLQMMSLADLAQLSLTYEPLSHHLTLQRSGEAKPLFEGVLTQEDDAKRLCQIVARFVNGAKTAPPPRLFTMETGGLTDTKTPYVAFGNAASISQFAKADGHLDDHRRYRLNVIMTGAPTWSEFDLIGKSARLGTAEYTFVEPVGRCAAIEVDPQTAIRKKGLVQSLHSHYGHTDMGVFASVTKSGNFCVGDQLVLL